MRVKFGLSDWIQIIIKRENRLEYESYWYSRLDYKKLRESTNIGNFGRRSRRVIRDIGEKDNERRADGGHKVKGSETITYKRSTVGDKRSNSSQESALPQASSLRRFTFDTIKGLRIQTLNILKNPEQKTKKWNEIDILSYFKSTYVRYSLGEILYIIVVRSLNHCELNVYGERKFFTKNIFEQKSIKSSKKKTSKQQHGLSTIRNRKH